MTVYIPNIFTNEYLNEKIILNLCLTKYFNTNIIQSIKPYLINYSTGFALFDYTKIKRHGHPIEPIINILSTFNITTSDNQFNVLLQEIQNIPNNKTIDVSNIYSYMITKYKHFEQELNNSNDIFVLLMLINKYIGLININKSCKIIRIIKNESNEYIKTIIRGTLIISLKYYNINNLTEYLIKNSQYDGIKVNNNIIWFEKKLIINDNILFFEISRFTYQNNKFKMLNNMFELPKILILPPFVFTYNITKQYELIAVIIYQKHNHKKYKYSYIIKKNDNYYHFKYTKIILIDDNYFNQVVSYNAIAAFYKML